VFLDFVYQPIVESDGNVSGILVEGIDVTDHVRAEEPVRFMNDELRHRIKNTLVTVSDVAKGVFRSDRSQEVPGSSVSSPKASFSQSFLTRTMQTTAKGVARNTPSRPKR